MGFDGRLFPPGPAVLLTVSHEHFSELRAFWKRLAGENPQRLGTTREEDERWGGKVVLIDWATKTMTHVIDLPLATGLLEYRGRVYVCSYRTIHVFDPELNEREVWRHPWFCNLHSISPMEGRGGFIVTAPGIDSVLRVTGDGEAALLWHGPSEGFPARPDHSLRTVDLTQDHSQVFHPTSAQTTHVNSAVWDAPRSRMVMTLFHQGIVLEVGANGSATLVEGLQAPHAAHVHADGGLYAADSAGARIIEVHAGGIRAIDLGRLTTWLQDVQWWPEMDAYLAVDSSNARVLLVDRNGQLLEEFRTGEDWRLHQVALVRQA